MQTLSSKVQETWDVTVVSDYLAKLGPPEKLDFESGYVDGIAFGVMWPPVCY